MLFIKYLTTVSWPMNRTYETLSNENSSRIRNVGGQEEKHLEHMRTWAKRAALFMQRILKVAAPSE